MEINAGLIILYVLLVLICVIATGFLFGLGFWFANKLIGARIEVEAEDDMIE